MLGQRDFPIALETSAHTLKLCQRRDDRIMRNAHFQCDRYRGERVQHVVHARQIKGDIQIFRLAILSALRGEAHLSALMADVHGADLRAFAETVSRHRLADARQYLAHVGVVHAQHRPSIERQVLDEIHERLLEPPEIVAVGFHVVGVNIGDHREYRLQMQERCIRFVGFDHDELARTQPGVAAAAVQFSADHKGRVESAPG